MKPAAEYIGIGLAILMVLYGCERCERQRDENHYRLEEMRMKQAAETEAGRLEARTTGEGSAR